MATPWELPGGSPSGRRRLHGDLVVYAYAAVFRAIGAVIAGLLLRREAMALLDKEPNSAEGTPEAEHVEAPIDVKWFYAADVNTGRKRQHP